MISVCRVVVAVVVGITLCGPVQAAPQGQPQPPAHPAARPGPADAGDAARGDQKPDEPPKYDETVVVTGPERRTEASRRRVDDERDHERGD